MNPHLLFFLACQLESNSRVPGGNSWQLKLLFRLSRMHGLDHVNHAHSPKRPLHDEVTLTRLTQLGRRLKVFLGVLRPAPYGSTTWLEQCVRSRANQPT